MYARAVSRRQCNSGGAGSRELPEGRSACSRAICASWNNPRRRNTIEETVTAGGSSLSYNATTNQYTYVWKTDKAWANTCRQLHVKLSDGTNHVADFKFTK